jgi:predicted Zn-dependent protease
MTAPRKKRSVHTRDGLAVIIAATLLFASCRNGAQFLALSELRVVRQQVSAVAGTTDVSVNLANGRVLTITVGNADVRANSGAQRQELFLQIATAAYLALPSRSQVEAVTVKDVAETHQFRPIQLIEPSGLADRWVKPDHTSQQVYFVAVGNVRFDLVKQLAAHFRQTPDLAIEELPAVPFDQAAFDNIRSQVVAEELLTAITRRYPDLADDVHARIIGVTGDDMYLRSARWTFGFSLRSDDGHVAVVSYARMDPVALGLSPDPEMLRNRVSKMVAKNIGVMYYGLPLSNNPRSALYGNIGGTDELDVMTEYFEPQPTEASAKSSRRNVIP